MSSERTGRAILSALLIVITLFLVVNYFAGGQDASLLSWLLLLIVLTAFSLVWTFYEPEKPSSTAIETAQKAEVAAQEAAKKAEAAKAAAQAKAEAPTAPPKPAPAPEPEPPKAEAPPEPAPAPEPEPPKAEAPPEPAPAPEPEPPKAEEPAPSGEPDDLTRIEGIGPKYRDALVSEGITTYAQLAEMSLDDIKAIIKKAGMRNTASMSTWAEQAKLAAAGDWDGLAKLQDELSGGRR
ncbi:MAG: hypothetical protein D6712_11745 [Chloroflexi bacterium]|nr:MAG: hypothetical protein D6712_11745 [Chloroflexota bacterium]